MTELGDVDTQDLREAVAAALTRMAGQGSVPAASALLKLLQEVERAELGEGHRARMKELAEEPAELARYLGELGESLEEVETRFGRAPSKEERAAWERGAADRTLEVKAVELGEARRGGALADWMHEK